MILWLLACGATPLDDLGHAQRQLWLHAAPGETVHGVGADWLEPAGLQAGDAEAAHWRVRPSQEEAPWSDALGADWVSPDDAWLETHLPVAQVGGQEIWRSRAHLPQGVALSALPEAAQVLDDPVFVGWRPIGGGEAWSVELYVRAPAHAPADPCVSLVVDGVAASGGRLAEGMPVWPGLEERPLLRHRLRLPIDTPVEVELSLTDCSAGTTLAQGPTLAPSSAARPSITALQARPGPLAEDFDPLRRAHQRQAFRQLSDGTLVPIEGPPLPRIRVGEAWAVMVGGSVDLTTVSDPGEETLAGLRSLFNATQAAVLTVDSPVTRLGSLQHSGPERPLRALPEDLTALDGLGVSGVVTGPGVARVEQVGQQDTYAQLAARWPVANAQAPMLALDPAAGVDDAAGVRTGPRVAVVRVGADRSGLSEQVAQARSWAHVVVAAVFDPAPLTDFAEELAAAGLDGAWVHRDALGPLVVHGNLVVLDGLPPLVGAAEGPMRETALLRLVVDHAGLRRIDLLPVQQRRGRLDWQEQGAGERLAAFAAVSLREGTDVRVGTALASSEVRDHHPPSAHPAPERPVPALAQSVLPAQLEQPPRCMAADAQGRHTDLDGLALLSASAPETVTPGSWVPVQLTWRAERALDAGRFQWALEGQGRTLRATTIPCEGAWGLEHWRPGAAVRDTVHLWVPEDMPSGPAKLSGVVQVGEEVARTRDGERRFEVLTLTVGAP